MSAAAGEGAGRSEEEAPGRPAWRVSVFFRGNAAVPPENARGTERPEVESFWAGPPEVFDRSTKGRHG